MTLTHDLEELKGDKHTKQCDICLFKQYPEGHWCFMHDEAPIKKCKDRLLSNRELNELKSLFKQYPSLGED